MLLPRSFSRLLLLRQTGPGAKRGLSSKAKPGPKPNVEEAFAFPSWLNPVVNSMVIGVFSWGAYKYFVKDREKKRLAATIESRIRVDKYVRGKFPLVVYKGCVVAEDMVLSGLMEKMEKFQARSDDIIVASYPKSGTTWLQEVVYIIMNKDVLYTDDDNEKKKKTLPDMETRFPYLEFPYPGLSAIEKIKTRRLLKTHLPLKLLPESIRRKDGPKVIYIHRNPKDVAVSYFHFSRMLKYIQFEGSFNRFCLKFLEEEVPYSPYFPHLADYIQSAQAEPSRFLSVRYEDMHENPFREIRRINTFLLGDTEDAKLSDEEVFAIAERTTFQAMKENPSTNYEHWDSFGLRVMSETQFMRKGQVGDHRNYLQDKYLALQFEEWLEQNCQKYDLPRALVEGGKKEVETSVEEEMKVAEG